MAKSDPTPSLAAHALKLSNARPRSMVEIVADDMDPTLRAEYVAAINDRKVPASGLSRALAARGIKVPAQSITHWRSQGKVLA